MSRRKKKDSPEEVMGGGILLITFAAFTYTRSVSIALTVGISLLVIMILIMRSVNAKWKNKVNASGILEIDKMTGIQFEEFLMIRYQSMGYEVRDTPKSGDFGADLLLQKDSKKIVVQAKRYTKSVGIKAVQEVTSAKPYYRADEAWVITNSYFTKAAVKLAFSNNVKLIDREQLMDLLTKNIASQVKLKGQVQ
jgi:restriction system protein